MKGVQIEPDWFDGVKKEDVRERKKQLPVEFSQAFEDIRSWGVDTIEGFGCCSGCTAASFGDKPGAYYHEQDINAWAKDVEGRHGFRREFTQSLPDSVQIGFCTPDGKKVREVGQVVTSAFRERGFDVEWDNNAESRVKVNL